MKRYLTEYVAFSTLLLVLVGCGSVPVGPEKKSAGVLITNDRFFPAVSEITDTDAAEHFYRNFTVTRRGTRRRAMVLVAPASIRASLTGVSGPVVLKGLAAPVFNLGDGFQMDVILLGSDEERQVYKRYMDPGRRESDRAWLPLEIPFDLEQTKPWQLEFRLSAGPQGDLVGDWLALAGIELVRKVVGQ